MSAEIKNALERLPRLPRHCNSWVAVSKTTGEVAVETFDPRVAASIDQEKYNVIPAYEWLVSLNNRRAQ